MRTSSKRISSVLSLLYLIAALTACGLLVDYGYHVRGDDVYLTTGGGDEGPVVTEKVLGADGKTFRALTYGFGKDERSVFIGYYKIPNADSGSFEVLSEGYARDKFRAYLLGFPIESSDPGSFKVITPGRARDRFHCYNDQVPSACRE